MSRFVIVLFVLFPLLHACADYIAIFNVEVLPASPAYDEEIMLYVDGEIGSIPDSLSPVVIISADSVVLDLYFNYGGGLSTPVVTSWDHTENIGSLPRGAYSLTVNTYGNATGSYMSGDSVQAGFTVIPEPSTVGLLAAGGLIAYGRRAKMGRLRRTCWRN